MSKITETVIEADPKLPVIWMARDFAATPGQLFRARTDPVLFARWVGPGAMTTRIEHWDARTGGSWRYVAERDGVEYGFRGCFHEVRPDRIVQTFTFEGDPDGVALGTLPGSRYPAMRIPRPGCWVSSAGTRSGRGREPLSERDDQAAELV
jgi:uncharacterized protein YndB with AHSA1/START domain